MAYAIFYDFQDLTPFTALIQNNQLTNQERQLANKIWQGGLSNWADPANLVGAADPHSGGDPDCRRIIISYNGASLADLINLCRTVGNRVPGAIFLDAIASDLLTTGVEPWPPV